MRAKAVIFDMDGLMFNTEDILHDVQTELLSRRHKKFTLDLKRKIMGLKAEAVMQTLKSELNLDDEVADLINERNELYLSTLRPRLKPMYGLLDLLSLLEESGIRKSVATSSPAHWAKIILSHFAMESMFEVIVTGDEITHGKPHPQIYRETLTRLTLKSEDVVVLEDSINGVLAAKNAGLKCVAVPNEFTLGTDFSISDLVVNNLFDPQLINFLGLSL